MITAAIATEPIDAAALERSVADERCGAVVAFAGVVRNHDHGEAVTGIEYSAHPSATDILAGVAAEAAARDQVHAVALAHRVGALAVGDVAMVAVVAAEHRAEAFAACAALVDAVKARAPIWKKQALADGRHEWSNLP